MAKEMLGGKASEPAAWVQEELVCERDRGDVWQANDGDSPPGNKGTFRACWGGCAVLELVVAD